jgi:general secretion pathway protein L
MVGGMQVGVICARWVEGLAAVLLACRELRRAGRVVIVSHENGQFVVKQGAPANRFTRLINKIEKQGTPVANCLTRLINKIEKRQPLPAAGSVLAVVPEGSPAPDEVVRAARSGFVVLELPSHELVVRRFSVPAQAREFLPGIVRNRIERLSPWQVEETLYGFEAIDREDATALDVRVFVASRAMVANSRAQFAAIGLQLDRIVARSDEESAHSVSLWSRLADTAPENSDQVRRQIGATITAVLTLSVGLSFWALSSAASNRGESEQLAARTSTLQRQLQGSRASGTASLAPAERAWIAKESAPSAVIVLEALARALPDTAHLTELRLEGTTLRIIGLADDPPSLIAPLERTGHFTGVRFIAPTTRGPDGARFRFSIEARIVPRLEIAEN